MYHSLFRLHWLYFQDGENKQRREKQEQEREQKKKQKAEQKRKDMEGDTERKDVENTEKKDASLKDPHDSMKQLTDIIYKKMELKCVSKDCHSSTNVSNKGYCKVRLLHCFFCPPCCFPNVFQFFALHV